MATYSKLPLTGSTLGVGVVVAATSPAGTAIHAVPNTVGMYDDVWLYAFNTAAAAVVLTVWWGGEVAGDHDIVMSIPADEGLQLIIPGVVLGQNKAITATAATGDVVVIIGHVNRITA